MTMVWLYIRLLNSSERIISSLFNQPINIHDQCVVRLAGLARAAAVDRAVVVDAGKGGGGQAALDGRGREDQSHLVFARHGVFTGVWAELIRVPHFLHTESNAPIPLPLTARKS